MGPRSGAGSCSRPAEGRIGRVTDGGNRRDRGGQRCPLPRSPGRYLSRAPSRSAMMMAREPSEVPADPLQGRDVEMLGRGLLLAVTAVALAAPTSAGAQTLS